MATFMSFTELAADTTITADLMTFSSTTSAVSSISAYIYLESSNWNTFIATSGSTTEETDFLASVSNTYDGYTRAMSLTSTYTDSSLMTAGQMYGACWYKTNDSLSCVTITSDGTGTTAAGTTGLTVSHYYENIYGNNAYAKNNDAVGKAVTSLTAVTAPAYPGFENYWWVDSTAIAQTGFEAWLY